MTQMIDSISVTRDNIYKGAGRLVVSDPDTLTSFPGRLESIMSPATPVTGTAYALADGWSDLGPTTEDGITIRREASLSDGIPVDQRNNPLDEGEPDSWAMSLDCTLMDTSLANINKAWEAGTQRAYDADGGHVAQGSLDLDAPATFTERMLAVIQEDPKTGKLRAFAFRKATPKVDGSELNVQSGEATGLPVSFTLKTDTTVSEGSGQFGRIYEES